MGLPSPQNDTCDSCLIIWLIQFLEHIGVKLISNRNNVFILDINHSGKYVKILTSMTVSEEYIKKLMVKELLIKLITNKKNIQTE